MTNAEHPDGTEPNESSYEIDKRLLTLLNHTLYTNTLTKTYREAV